jgi:hypothetical protein
MAQQLAWNAELKAHRRTPAGVELDLVLAEGNRHLADKGYQDKLAEALSAALGARVRLKVELGAASEMSLAAQDRRAKAALLDQATTTFTEDPFVKDALRLFDARIRTETIQPITAGPAGVPQRGNES